MLTNGRKWVECNGSQMRTHQKTRTHKKKVKQIFCTTVLLKHA